MRAALIAAAAAAALPVPALAQDRHDDSHRAAADRQDDAHRMAREMNDPARQAEMAATVEGMAGVLLEMPVGPLMRAAATMAGENPDYVDPDTRIGDVVGPEAADVPREIAQRLPRMMGAMAEMTVALEDMLPQLAEVGARARAAARGHHD
ncbi:MAG: hypothetical protein ABIP41_03395 [Croceibacterium sp.]